MVDAVANFAATTVATAPSPATSGTSLTVAAGAGALFPAAPFNVTVWPSGAQATAGTAEIVRVTAKASDTFTIVRAQEGSTARSVVVGDQVAQTVTAGLFSDIGKLPGVVEYVTGLSSLSTAGDANAALINAAITSAAVSGGLVGIPLGTWFIGQLRMKSNVTLFGQSRTSTTLKAKASLNAPMVVLDTTTTVAVEIHDLAFDGNKANQTSGGGVSFNNLVTTPDYDANHRLFNLVIANTAGDGLAVTGDRGQSQVMYVFSNANSGRGFYSSGPDNQFYGCIAINSGLQGFHITGASNRLVSCKSFLSGFVDYTKGNGFAFENAPRVDAQDLEAQDNRFHGFNLVNTPDSNYQLRADRNGLGPEPVTTGGYGDGLYAQQVVRSIVNLTTGDRAAGTVLQNWGFNCGASNSQNIVQITVGTNKQATGYTGSWGADSFVTVAFNGAVVLSGDGRAKTATVQVFTASGTWTKSTGCTSVGVLLVHGGGGGGSGRRGVSATLRTGGGGGAGSMFASVSMPASLLGATESVVVGAGGVGGAAASVDSTDGAAGGAGGLSSFGTSGSTLFAGGAVSAGGSGGNSTGAAAGGVAGAGQTVGGSGAASSASGAAGVIAVAAGGSGGGGSGGGLSTANTSVVGGAGIHSAIVGSGIAGGSAGAVGAAGGVGGSSPASLGRPGAGGGGGGSTSTAASGAGGNGGIYGGGGGGGAASLNGFASGKGGDGGAGIVIVTSYF